jgi:hypothetical protein
MMEKLCVSSIHRKLNADASYTCALPKHLLSTKKPTDLQFQLRFFPVAPVQCSEKTLNKRGGGGMGCYRKQTKEQEQEQAAECAKKEEENKLRITDGETVVSANECRDGYNSFFRS